jgi:hypothetical protein
VVLLNVIFVEWTSMVPTLMPRGTNRNTPVIASSASTHCTQHNHDSVADGSVSAAATAEGQLHGNVEECCCRCSLLPEYGHRRGRGMCLLPGQGAAA